MVRLYLVPLATLISRAAPASAFVSPSAVGLRDSRSAALSCTPSTTTRVNDVARRPTACGTRLSMSTADAAAVPPSSPAAEAAALPGPQTTVKEGAKISNEWELDVYSRPVVGADGKKLWELLICDSTGNMRHVSPIPSNMVNSREVRKTIEGVIEAAPGGSRPTVIRFFRNAMFNMIDIALKEVEVAVKPCRTTYAMYQWLEQRERDVYPNMPGYKSTMKQPAFFDIRVRIDSL